MFQNVMLKRIKRSDLFHTKNLKVLYSKLSSGRNIFIFRGGLFEMSIIVLLTGLSDYYPQLLGVVQPD